MDTANELPLVTVRTKPYPQRLLKPFLQGKLGSNYTWATKGLLRIFERQTADEQRSDVTVEANSVGFTGIDAEILSSFAKQVNNGRILSEAQRNILFAKMPKYWKQLLSISDAKMLHGLMEKENIS